MLFGAEARSDVDHWECDLEGCVPISGSFLCSLLPDYHDVKQLSSTQALPLYSSCL